jgi:glycosyltransferase involved in cell wall biosynthesis
VYYYFNNSAKAREIGNEAAKYVKENYSWEIFATKLKKIIKKY